MHKKSVQNWTSKGAELLQTWPKVMTTTWSEVHKKKVIYSTFQLNMSKHVWQECGKLYFKYFQLKKGIIPTKIDDALL